MFGFFKKEKEKEKEIVKYIVIENEQQVQDAVKILWEKYDKMEKVGLPVNRSARFDFWSYTKKLIDKDLNELIDKHGDKYTLEIRSRDILNPTIQATFNVEKKNG